MPTTTLNFHLFEYEVERRQGWCLDLSKVSLELIEVCKDLHEKYSWSFNLFHILLVNLNITQTIHTWEYKACFLSIKTHIEVRSDLDFPSDMLHIQVRNLCILLPLMILKLMILESWTNDNHKRHPWVYLHLLYNLYILSNKVLNSV